MDQSRFLEGAVALRKDLHPWFLRIPAYIDKINAVKTEILTV